jgi:hypothetical protein
MVALTTMPSRAFKFPEDLHACSAITLKCWLLPYGSAKEVLRAILAVEKGLADTGDTQG